VPCSFSTLIELPSTERSVIIFENMNLTGYDSYPSFGRQYTSSVFLLQVLILQFPVTPRGKYECPSDAAVNVDPANSVPKDNYFVRTEFVYCSEVLN
jgi:hypothetical protein